MKVLVVGAGIMGLAAAWALRRRGVEVTVLEQGPFPNPLASSVDDHRGMRRGYGPERGYQDMARQALAAWERLSADLGRPLYVETGILYLAAEHDPWLAATVDGFVAEGLGFERLEVEEVRRRFPVVIADDVGTAVLAASAGPLRAGEIVSSLGNWLAAHGARIWPNQKVAAVDLDQAAVTLADDSRIEGDRLIVAAGPWTPRLLPAYATRVTPSRQVLVYLEPPPELMPAWQGMPVVADLTTREAGIYVIPPAQGMRLKIGDHQLGMSGDPDRDRLATATDTALIMAKARSRLSGLDRFVHLETRICLYDMAADERFLAERVGRSIVLTGFSGHGFKFGAVIGERVAAVVAGEGDAAALALWASGRGI